MEHRHWLFQQPVQEDRRRKKVRRGLRALKRSAQLPEAG